VFFASLLRCLPLLLPAGSSRSSSLVAIHVAQFINGAAAPLVVLSPSYLSLVWFPDSQRNTATAMANVANALGRAVGFFLGPALVSRGADLPTLLFVEVGLLALPLVGALAFCPAAPRVPPSAAAAAEAALWAAKGGAQRGRDIGTPAAAEAAAPLLLGGALGEDAWRGEVGADGEQQVVAAATGPLGSGLKAAAREAWLAARSRDFLAVAGSGGLSMAMYGAWSGVITSALTAPEVGFSNAAAGAMGYATTFAGIAGGLLAGWATDLPALRRSLKTAVVLLSLAAAALLAPIAAALPPLAGALGGGLASGLGASFPAILALATLAGLLRGATDPLFFELAAEAAHSVGAGAGAAGALLTLLYHLALCAALSVPAAPLQAAVLTGMPVALIISAAIILPARIKYLRRG
jgi:hypothetical protein